MLKEKQKVWLKSYALLPPIKKAPSSQGLMVPEMVMSLACIVNSYACRLPGKKALEAGTRNSALLNRIINTGLLVGQSRLGIEIQQRIRVNGIVCMIFGIQFIFSMDLCVGYIA